MAAVTAVLPADTAVFMDTKIAAIGVETHGETILLAVRGAEIGAATIGLAATGKAAEKESAAAMEMDLAGRLMLLRSIILLLVQCGMTRIPTDGQCGDKI